MKRTVLIGLFLIAVIILAACGAPAPASTMAPSYDSAGVAQEGPAPVEAQPQSPPVEESRAMAAPTAVVMDIAGDVAGGGQEAIQTNRMIIKNADMRLLVDDTDVAIDRITQIAGDSGGYIVSSRMWFQDYYGVNYKYASISLGVPVSEFENVLRRLRGISVRVLDEQASGEDVTDQYVDLQSQLTNLEATRERIRGFLKDAKTVEEALKINQELTSIEDQIEQIKGRMNYFKDRAAFSTIAINLEPVLPDLTPTPVPTNTPTPTPRPTLTPTPWTPGETFRESTETLVITYQGLTNVLIWFVVAVVPVLLPFVVLVFLFRWFVIRKAVKK